MNAKEAIEKIKSMLSNDDKKIELAEAKLMDGTIIEAESFEPESGVFVISDDERVPLPVGDYELEDGQMLIVVEEGVIAEIKPAGDESEGEPEMEKESEMEKEQQFASLDEFNELKSKVDQMIGLLENLSAEKPDEKEVEKTEMSSDEKVIHSPEKNEKLKFNFNKNVKTNSTLSRILTKINS